MLEPSASKPLLFVGVGILLFEMLFQQLQRVGVALQALSGDGGEAGQTGVAHLAEVFAGLDCANVDLHSRDGDGFERVQDGHACVRVGGRVDGDAVDLGIRSPLLYPTELMEQITARPSKHKPVRRK